MGARPGLRRLAVVTLVAVALAGCATQSTSPDAPVNSPRVQPALVNPAWKGCWAVRPFQTTFEPNSVPGAGAVPQDFRPVSAVECVEDRRHSADGSIVSMAVERRSSGVAGLMAAFALPSLHQAGVTCAGVGWEPPWLFLLDREGRWISPQIPTDACEQPRKELSAAYRSTRFTDTRTRLIRVEEPAAAIKAGCSGHETDWPWFVTLERRKKAGTLTTDPLDGRRSRLCVYSVAGQEEGPTRPPGQFVAGRRLSRPDRSAIVRAMIGTAPADPCRRPADTFAALHRIDNRGTSVYVELTGCRRVVVVRGENDYLLSRASPGLLALLGA